MFASQIDGLQTWYPHLSFSRSCFWHGLPVIRFGGKERSSEHQFQAVYRFRTAHLKKNGWNTHGGLWKIMFLFNWVMFRFHVSIWRVSPAIVLISFKLEFAASSPSKRRSFPLTRRVIQILG